MIQTSDIILLVSVFVAVIVFAFLNQRGIGKITPKIDELKQGLSQLESKNQNNISLVTDARKRQFIDMPSVILHYINRKKFKQFYSREFQKSLSLENVTDVTTNAIQGNLDGNAGGVIQAGLKQAKTSEKTSNFTVDNEEILLNLFLEYQTATIEKDKVTLGIETVEVLDAQTISDNMRQDSKTLGAQLTEKVIGQTIRKIEKTKRLVLIEGDFDIQVVGENYKYIFSHPINNYISDSNEHVTFSFTVPIAALEDEVKTLYEESRVQITVYGYVMQYINSEKGVFNLKIIPIAIY